MCATHMEDGHTETSNDLPAERDWRSLAGGAETRPTLGELGPAGSGVSSVVLRSAHVVPR